MKYVQINAYGYGSTGSIMRNIHKERLRDGDESYIAWARGPASREPNEYRFGTKFYVYMHAGLHRLFGMGGLMGSKRATEQLVSWLEDIDPDVVHLHNLHGYTIHLPVLFNYLKRAEKPVVWTLHDCWAFTGHCGYFTYAKCLQWISHCGHEASCPQKHMAPKTAAGTWAVRRSFELKKKLFCSLEKVDIVTPSQWLADLAGQSYLGKYPISVKNNVIDENVFRPVESDARRRYGIGNRIMVLGVASPWTERKGFGDYLAVAQRLPSDYVMVLVGLSERQMRSLPQGIIGMTRTSDARQLAELYSAADVFLLLSYEENYPTVALEARACGTRIIAYDSGGSLEAAGQDAVAVPVGNIKEVISAIMSMKKGT